MDIIAMVIIKLDIIKYDYNQHSGGYKKEDRKQNIKQKEEITEAVVEEGKVGDMPMRQIKSMKIKE